MQQAAARLAQSPTRPVRSPSKASTMSRLKRGRFGPDLVKPTFEESTVWICYSCQDWCQRQCDFTVWGKKRGLFRSLHGRCSSHPLYKGFVKYLFIWKVQGIGNSLFADGYSYRLHPPKMRRMPTSQRPLSCMVHLCQVLFSAEIWQHIRCVNPYVIFTNILHTNQSLPDFFHDNLRPALTTCALVRPVVKHNAAPVAT